MKYLCGISLLFFVSFVAGASKENEPKKYYALCREIDAVDARDMASSISQIKLKKDYNDVRGCQCELDLLRQHQEEKREYVLHEFKNYYEIDDNNWNAMRSLLTNMYAFRKEKKKVAIDRDNNFSASAQKLIEEELLKRKISMSRIKLLSKVNDPFAYSVQQLSEKKGVIGINLKFWRRSSSSLKQFMSACAVEELTEELSLFGVLLKYWWDRIIPLHKQQDAKGFIRLKEMTRVVSMHSVCRMSEKEATLVKKYAHSVVNQSFTSDDYKFISKVERYWRLLNIGKQHCIPTLCLRPSMIRPNNNSFSSGNMASVSQESSNEGSIEEQKSN